MVQKLARRGGITGTTCRILGLLAIVLVSLDPSRALATQRFSRGIAVAHALAWAPMEPTPSSQFVSSPFADESRSLALEELTTLRRIGFDFVRLAIDPGPFLQFKGSNRDALDAILMDHVRKILSSGLSVIVDFHPSDLNPMYTSEALTAGVRTPLFQAYLDLLGRTATLLAAVDPGRVALEIMNEPVVSTSAWQPMLVAGYEAIRARTRTLPVIVSGGGEGSAEGLMQIATRAFGDDAAVLYSFHFYDPYQFTHQGAAWNPARFLANVPYPADARPLDESVTATLGAIEASQLSRGAMKDAYADALKRLQSYRSSRFGRETVARAFDRVARWAQVHGVPADRILLGEFGAVRTERQLTEPGASERPRWFRDVREEAERRGFGWAVWVYRGSGGFALAPPEAGTPIDSAILAALGLLAQPRD